MKISDIIKKDRIFIGLKAGSKRQLLQELAQKAAQVTGLSDRTVFDALLERENLGSTGFGGGTALPHARLEDLKEIYGFFVRLDSPINFDSVDNRAVDLVFMLLSPDASGADHLTALAQVSRLLKDEGTCEKLRQAVSEEEVYALLNN